LPPSSSPWQTIWRHRHFLLYLDHSGGFIAVVGRSRAIEKAEGHGVAFPSDLADTATYILE
jgi:hypothetical protein